MKIKILVFSIALLLLFGCSSKNPLKYSRGEELVFWHAMGGPMQKVLNELIEEYNSTNPKFRIRPINKGSYSALIQSLLAGIPAKDLPDMSQAYESWTSKLIDNEIIIPLQQYYDLLPDAEKNDFYPAFIENNTFNGKLWSIPFNKSVPILYYNKDMFEANGLNPPEKWDIDPKLSEFDRVCKALTRDDDGDGIPNQWGYAFNLSVWTFECLLLQSGGLLADEAETKALFDSKEGRESIDWWHSLEKKKYAFRTRGYDFQNNFAAGDVGMIMTSSVSKFFLRNKLTFNLGIAEPPYRVKKAVILSGTNIVVIKSAPEREKAAWAFLHWLTTPEITAKWAVKTNYLPVRRSAMDTDIVKQAIADDPTFLIPLKTLDYAYFEPKGSGWYNSRNILSEAIEMIMLDLLDSEKALSDAAKKINVELNK
ncbi:ABC transporter substrate-binding protein [bacterium]|nr:ABC transporter substrate-binding protein [bacterium]